MAALLLYNSFLYYLVYCYGNPQFVKLNYIKNRQEENKCLIIEKFIHGLEIPKQYT